MLLQALRVEIEMKNLNLRGNVSSAKRCGNAIPTRSHPTTRLLTPLQLPSVHHNPSCDGCARDAEENRMRKSLADKT